MENGKQKEKMMTNKKLIERLKKLDPEANVYIEHPCGGVYEVVKKCDVIEENREIYIVKNIGETDERD